MAEENVIVDKAAYQSNRRYMAWTALATMLIATTAVLIWPGRFAAADSILMMMYGSLSALVGAYFGFAMPKKKQMKYNTSQLLDMLIRDEGLELKVYKDTLGIDTIGAGRNLRDRPLTVAQLQHLGLSDMQDLYDNGITLYGARYILRIDVDIAERELITAHSCVEFLNAPRQMVCVNMAFNLGVPRLKLFKNMWSAIHRKDYERASIEMLDSRWAKQVKGRATRLSDIMRTGELNDQTVHRKSGKIPRCTI